MCVVPPTVDAGTPDGGAMTQDAGLDAGAPAQYALQGNGCGCRVGGAPARSSKGLLALGVVGLLVAMRRRRRDEGTVAQ
jgi:MYXO-CTERM domain-containing protein